MSDLPNLGTPPSPEAIVEEVADAIGDAIENVANSTANVAAPQSGAARSILKDPFFWVAVGLAGYLIYLEIDKRRRNKLAVANYIANNQPIQGKELNGNVGTETRTNEGPNSGDLIDFSKIKGPNENPIGGIQFPPSNRGSGRGSKPKS